MRSFPIASVCLLAASGVLSACGRNLSHATTSPTPSAPGLSPVAALGEQLFKDVSLSLSGRLACQTCHQPEFAHAAPSDGARFAWRARHGHTGHPQFALDPLCGLYAAVRIRRGGHAFGGLFRDGRVPDLVEQAKQPFLDAREMANPSADAVVARLRRSLNAARFRAVFGRAALDDSPQAFRASRWRSRNTSCELPDFHRFDSKYDAWLAGKAVAGRHRRRAASIFSRIPRKAIAQRAIRAGRRGRLAAAFHGLHLRQRRATAKRGIPANADPALPRPGLCGPERKILPRAAISAAPSKCRRSATSRAPRRTFTMAASRRCARPSTSTCAATRTPTSGSRNLPRAS